MGDDKLNRLWSIHRQILTCKRCPLSKTRSYAVPGEGPLDARIFFIGQAPGKREDLSGRPFVGRAGKFLNSLFSKYKISREEVFITSTVKCFPPKNRPPSKEEIKACKFFTINQLKLINPEIIVFLGRVAQQGFQDEPFCRRKTVIRAVHPASAMRFQKMGKRIEKDFLKIKRAIER